MKVMDVRDVYHIKGTILVGYLECDVKVGETFIIGSEQAILMNIESWNKSKESANRGEGVALLFRDLKNDVKPGTIITK